MWNQVKKPFEEKSDFMFEIVKKQTTLNETNTLVVFSGFIINELVWSVKGQVEVDGEKQTVSLSSVQKFPPVLVFSPASSVFTFKMRNVRRRKFPSEGRRVNVKSGGGNVTQERSSSSLGIQLWRGGGSVSRRVEGQLLGRMSLDLNSWNTEPHGSVRRNDRSEVYRAPCSAHRRFTLWWSDVEVLWRPLLGVGAAALLRRDVVQHDGRQAVTRWVVRTGHASRDVSLQRTNRTMWVTAEWEQSRTSGSHSDIWTQQNIGPDVCS